MRSYALSDSVVVADRVHPAGNHRYATVLEVYPDQSALVRCDCGGPGWRCPAGTFRALSRATPISVRALQDGLAGTSHGRIDAAPGKLIYRDREQRWYRLTDSGPRLVGDP